MKEADVKTIVQRVLEKYPGDTPRIIPDNGPQFIARDFKAFAQICGLTHVRTSPYYPQSNGKLERLHLSLKCECVSPQPIETLEGALRKVADYVEHYNTGRLHSAIGYITPLDKLAGNEDAIFAERDRKLEAARKQRQLRRPQARNVA